MPAGPEARLQYRIRSICGFRDKRNLDRGSVVVAVCRTGHGDVPDVPTVIADRTIGRETSHPGGIEYGHPRPVALVAIGAADARLAVDVGLVVGQQHVLVTG